MFGWHHQLSGHEFTQTLGDGAGQRRRVCCCPWGHKWWGLTWQVNSKCKCRPANTLPHSPATPVLEGLTYLSLLASDFCVVTSPLELCCRWVGKGFLLYQKLPKPTAICVFHHLFSRASLLIPPTSLNSVRTVLPLLANHVVSEREWQSILGTIWEKRAILTIKRSPNTICDHASGSAFTQSCYSSFTDTQSPSVSIIFPQRFSCLSFISLYFFPFCFMCLSFQLSGS